MISVLSIPAAYSFGGDTRGNSFFDLTRFIAVKYTGVVNEIKTPQPINVILHEYKTPFFLYGCKRAMKDLLKEQQFDLQHPLIPFCISNPFPYSTEIPLITTVEVPHGLTTGFIEKPFKVCKNKMDYFKARSILEYSERVVAVNTRTADFYREHFSLGNVVVIPHGVDSSEIKYSPNDLNHEILVIGMSYRKGTDILIKALHEVTKTYDDVVLHVVGTFDQDIFMQMQDLNTDHTIYHGFVQREDLIKLFKRARLFCHPSRGEGFSFPILEAMATGRPVVASDTVGNDMVIQNKTGFIIEQEDVYGFADAIGKIFDSDVLTRSMGERAHQEVIRTYRWDLIAEQYLKLYQDVI